MKYLIPKKKNPLNKLYIGLIGGIIVPLLFFSLYYIFEFADYKTIPEFVTDSIGRGVFSKILSLCAIPNLILFFAFLRTDKYFAARGVIIATLLLVFVVLILKIVW